MPLKQRSRHFQPEERKESGCSYPLGLIPLTDEQRSLLNAEGVDMKTEHQFDELIKAAWGVIESDFDPVAFQHWRLKAFECLTAMFGSEHAYTKYFEHFVQQGGRASALAAGGVLAAAKQQWAGKQVEPSKPLNC